MSQEKQKEKSPDSIRPQSTACRGTAENEKTKQMIDQIDGDQEIDLTEEINNNNPNNKGSSIDLKIDEVKV